MPPIIKKRPMFSMVSNIMLRSVATKHLVHKKEETLRYAQSDKHYNNRGCSPST